MRAWALPASILAAAPESPWGFPIEPFRTRVERAKPGALTYANRRALEALPMGGTVLDIGVGSGAASLPLHPRCSMIVGANSADASLAEFRRQARRVGVAARTVKGRWPDVQRRAPVADVVVCNHVAYNVGDLAPFVLALHAHARHRVVHGDHTPSSHVVDGRPVAAFPRPRTAGATGCDRRRVPHPWSQVARPSPQRTAGARRRWLRAARGRRGVDPAPPLPRFESRC